MSFDLTQLPRITSRIVKVAGRVFELWSPNSTQLPFFPGCRHPKHLPHTPTLLEERRYDGHCSKHDNLYVPQYFRKDTPHWLFMRHVPAVSTSDYAAPAFASLTRHWVEDPTNPTRGHLDPDSTWRTRPLYASHDRIMALLAARSWEMAVDRAVAVQRGLREQDAWVAWVKARHQQRPVTQDSLPWRQFPLADKSFLGVWVNVWVNGMNQEMVLRHLLAGIPCFIIHEYLPGEEVRRVPDDLVFLDFVSGTLVATLLGDDNPYQSLARRDSGRLDTVATTNDGRAVALPPSDSSEQLSSSSLHLEGLTKPEAWNQSPPSITPGSGSSVAPRLPRAPSPAARSSSASHAPIVVPDAPDAAKDRYAVPVYQRRQIASDRVDWYVPPPIHPQRRGPGKWAKFKVNDVEGVLAFVYRSKKYATTSRHVGYDRENRRELHYRSHRPPAGVVSDEEFGVPTPGPLPYFVLDGERAVPQRPSHWMYYSRDPSRSDEGRVAPTPHPSELPLLVDIKLEEAEPEMGEGKGKGKAKAAASTEENEDEEMLSRDEGYDSPPAEDWVNPDVDGGMDVDEPTPEETPSNVVNIDGLDSSIDAVMFRRLASDAFFTNGATPLTIFRGQGRMWVRFATTTEGRRAFRSLARLQPGLSVVSTDATFSEAITYSCDVWTWALEPSADDVAMGELDTEERLRAAPVEEPTLPSSAPSKPRSPVEESSPVMPDETTSVVEAPFAPAPAAVDPPSAPAPAVEPSGPPRPIPMAPKSLRVPPNPFWTPAARGTSDSPSTSKWFTAMAAAKRPDLPVRPKLSELPTRPRRTLEDRLSSPVPLAQRMASSAPSLAQRMRNPPYGFPNRGAPGPSTSPHKKQQRRPSAAAALPTPPLPPPQLPLSLPLPAPSIMAHKKVRCGKRYGRLVREMEELKAERHRLAILAESTQETDREFAGSGGTEMAEAGPSETTNDNAVASGSGSATAEEEETMADELEPGERLPRWGWKHDDEEEDDNPPAAAPYHD
ncbi:hypothetical protein B0H11DRAFT_2247056 [Mycena galericulata]|nr:hypothetical protein B0H11DRAFT_2247056 [Mycena galericulata]